MTFGEKIQKLRKESGLSQEELACQLGVSRQAISKWERDSGYPETDKIIRMGKLFHVTLDYLLNEEGTSSSGPDMPDGLYVSRESAEGFLTYQKRKFVKIATAVGLMVAGLSLSFIDSGDILFMFFLIAAILLLISIPLTDDPYRNFYQEPLFFDKNVLTELRSIYAEKKGRLLAATLGGAALIGIGLLVFPLLLPSQSAADEMTISAGMLLAGAGSFFCIYAHGMTRTYRRLTMNEVFFRNTQKKG